MLFRSRAIYYAAWWAPDRDVPAANELWTTLRDAAGLYHGAVAAELGPNRWHITADHLDQTHEPGERAPLFYDMRQFCTDVLGAPDGSPANGSDAHAMAKMFMAYWRVQRGTSHDDDNIWLNAHAIRRDMNNKARGIRARLAELEEAVKKKEHAAA